MTHLKGRGTTHDLPGGARVTPLCERLFAYRHLFALPALAIAFPFLFCRWGHIPDTGVLALAWDAIAGCALFSGQGLRLWAAGYMGRAGRSRRLKAATLLTAGPYAHVRNPLYLGNFLLCVGVVLWTESYLLLPLAVLIFWVLYLPVIFTEEEFLREQFGTSYTAYCLMVPRLLPRLKAAGPGQGTFRWRNLRKEYLSVTGTLSAVLAVTALESPAHPVRLLVLAGLLLLVPHVVESALKRGRRSAAGNGERPRETPEIALACSCRGRPDRLQFVRKGAEFKDHPARGEGEG